jgi:hypothetical protein
MAATAMLQVGLGVYGKAAVVASVPGLHLGILVSPPAAATRNPRRSGGGVEGGQGRNPKRFGGMRAWE